MAEEPLPEGLRPLLTRRDLCRLLGVTNTTLYRWSRKGYGPVPIHIGSGAKGIRYHLDEVESFLRERQMDSTAVQQLIGEVVNG